jgi:integrase
MACLYLRKNIYWITYYKDGVRFSKSLKTNSKSKAKLLKNKLEIDLAQGDDPAPKPTASAITAFLAFKADRDGRITRKTAIADHHRVELFIESAPVEKLSKITESMVKAHIDSRIADGISIQTANHTIRILKTFFNFCVKHKYMTENPIRYMPKYKQDAKEQRYLTPAEISALLRVSRPTRAFPIIMTAIYAGMRYGEIERLKADDIDFENNRINVRISKSGRFRHIPIHKDLRPVLQGIGDGFDFSNFRGVFDAIKKDAGIDFRFHDLRHTFCALLIRNNVDIVTISKLAGHSTIKTTMTYAHLYQDHVQEAIEKLKI